MHAHIGTLKTQTPLTVSALYMRSSFGTEPHDFINVEIRESESLNSAYIRVPVEHVIAFHAAMVDALAPHVDEQRAAELAEDEKAEAEAAAYLKANGVPVGYEPMTESQAASIDKLAKAAPRDEPRTTNWFSISSERA